jgi:hypothetical protein
MTSPLEVCNEDKGAAEVNEQSLRNQPHGLALFSSTIPIPGKLGEQATRRMNYPAASGAESDPKRLKLLERKSGIQKATGSAGRCVGPKEDLQ